MKKFLKIHKSLTLNQKLENTNRPITSKETESLKKKNFKPRKAQEQMANSIKH